MKRVTIYPRASTGDQTCDKQLRDLPDYCRARGLEHVMEFVDQGISGTKKRRPALDKLMTLVRSSSRADSEGCSPGTLPGAYSCVLGLPDARPAWDVYLVYDRNARWDVEPPAPAQWMHQLAVGPAAQRLDADRLAREVGKLLGGGK